jgi:acid phosphatase
MTRSSLPRLASLLLLVFVVGVPAFGATFARRRAVESPVSSGAIGINAVTRVFMVVLENEDATNALDVPFFRALADRGALLRNYHALKHPSQPNYIALAAGDTYDVVDDETVTLNVPHLGDLLEAKGFGWKVYAEQYPGNCDLRDEIGTKASGVYARRHVPFLNFADVQNDPARCARIVGAEQFDRDLAGGTLPAFSMYIPNNNNNGHDTGVAYAGQAMSARFDKLLADPKFMAGTLFVVVFDEDGSHADGNLVDCTLAGPMVAPGTVSNVYYDHFDLLRTVEEIFHLGTLHRRDDLAVVMSDVWKR